MIVIYLWIAFVALAVGYYIFCPAASMEEQTFSYIYGIDTEGETNFYLTMASVDEASLMPLIRGIQADDTNYRKQSILAVVRDNNENACIKALNKALLGTDTETSHYASVALVGIWDQILGEHSTENEEEGIHNRIQFHLLTDNISGAAMDCKLYEELYPESERMVVDNLKFYIHTRDSSGLREFLHRINNYPITFSEYSLQYLSVLEEGQNA